MADQSAPAGSLPAGSLPAESPPSKTPPGRTLPARARVVIVGGGVGGTSVAFHLAERGERDVVVLDRDELTSGSTFHSAGLVGQLRADPTLTRMNMHSVELYRRLQRGEHAPGWVECGGIRLACTPERMEEIRRQIGWARTFGLPLEEISAAQAQELFPMMDTAGVLGGAHLPTDGYIDPSQLTYALAAGARAEGVRIITHTRVLGIEQRDGRVTGVRTDRGDIEAEVVVNCGGMFAAEIGRMAGVRIPLVPMSHQYLVTEALPGLPGRGDATRRRLPTLRDPDNLVYFREEVDGLLMGGYERDSAAWSLGSLGSGAGPRGTGYDAIPADFNGRLLPEDWPRFEEITVNSQVRVPGMADVGIRKLINGPEAFTPDNEFCLGETELGGLFVAAGFCAHGIAGAGGIGQVMASWVLDGDPGLDVWHMDVRRFGAHYRSPSYTLKKTTENYETYYDIPYPGRERTAGRPLRVSPAYAWHAAHGAVFGEKAGWERVNYYAPNGGQEGRSQGGGSDEGLRPHGWAGRHWSPAVGVEHAATRETAGLFDESSFSKIEVTGPGAARLLDWLCDNEVAREIGAVTYTQALNARGGIECDFTVTRTADDAFLIVTGTAFGTHDLSWIRRHARSLNGERAGSVRVADVTGQYACFALWGPRSRDILAGLTPAALDNDAFPYLTAQETTVGDVPVRALRVTFTGELGWELYCSSEYGAALWRTLWEAGRPYGLTAAGYHAIDSLRLEKGYRVWGADIGPDDNPYEAGLGFCVKLGKPGGFLGRDALVAARAAGLGRRLRCIVLDDPRAVCLGSEPVRVNGQILGRVTSGGFGHTTGLSIAYAYLPAGAEAQRIGPDTKVEVELFGEWVTGRITGGPLFDPKGERIRA
ncbi:GcvT family protein [Actinomadura scrupuli]|uniref:GcvT family protein n=1 Tax=Actinomadura scrupuli TaxID=559629 RepID=UPI003D99CB58